MRRAIVVALAGCRRARVILANRTERRAEDLALDIGGDIEVSAGADRGAALKTAGLLVNTTQLGQAGQPPLEIDLKHLPTGSRGRRHRLCADGNRIAGGGQSPGNRIVDGLGMLLHQAGRVLPPGSGWSRR